MDNQPIKVFKFTSYPDGYKCNRPGNNSGEYVSVFDYEDMESRAEFAESSLAAMRQRAEEAEKELKDTLSRHVDLFNSLKASWDKKGSRILSANCEETKRQGCYHPAMDSMREEGFRHGLNLGDQIGDASTIGGERERRLVEALRHVCKHLCQWNDACETGCIVSAALAEMEQKS